MAENAKSEKVGLLVGIDLGTTNSVVAYMKGKEPDVLYNRYGKQLTRSVVSLRQSRRKGSDEKGEILVGNAAVKNYPMAPEDTIMSIKRLMGIGYANPEVDKVKKSYQYEIVKPAQGTEDAVRVMMGGEEYSPEDISAIILSAIKEDAEDKLGQPVTHAVITVPAYFDQAQKAATRGAAIKAGLKVLKLLDEPTAAAIAYGMEEAESGEPKFVVVYDLGGGTFDVSVLMWGGYSFVPMDIEGDMWLGGDNFDQEIIDYVVELIKEDHGVDPTENKRFMSSLKLAAQEAKESLSYQNSAEIIIPNMLRDQDDFPLDIFVDITREQYEKMIEPYVDRSVALVEKAIAAAGFSDEDIDYFLLAGNASMTPLVEEKITARFGSERILKRKQPKHCVAEGAAIVAKVYQSVMCPNPECEHANDLDATVCSVCGTVLNRLVCPHCGEGNEPGVDVCAACGESLSGVTEGDRVDPGNIADRYYGIQYQGDNFAIFVEKNDSVPTKEGRRVSQKFPTRLPNQRIFYMPVYGGEDTERAAKNNIKQGEAFAILPPGQPQGTIVVITLWLNKDGIFELEAKLTDGTDLEPWIIKGEADDAAIKKLEVCEIEIRKKWDFMSDEHKQSVEEKREEIFDNLKSGKNQEAIENAEDLKNFLDLISDGNGGGGGGGGGGQPQSPEQKVRMLIGFIEFITKEYDWLMGMQKTQEYRELMNAGKQALNSGDPQAVKKALDAMENATSNKNLPKAVLLLLGMKMAIAQRIRPRDPKKAIELSDRLAETEALMKTNPSAGMEKFKALIEDIEKALKEMEPIDEPIPCPVEGCDGVIYPGAFTCTRGHNWAIGSFTSSK